MKKKILIGSIITVALLTLVSFSSVIGYSCIDANLDNPITNDNTDIDDKGKLESYYMSRGFIFGTYEVLDYVSFFQGISIHNPSEECTINVFGLYWEVEHYVLLNACSVIGSWFIGYCNNGRVFGYVFGTLSVLAEEL